MELQPLGLLMGGSTIAIWPLIIAAWRRQHPKSESEADSKSALPMLTQVEPEVRSRSKAARESVFSCWAAYKALAFTDSPFEEKKEQSQSQVSTTEVPETAVRVQARCPFEGAATGRLRWAVNSEAWNPEGAELGSEFQFLLSLIPEAAERTAVMRYQRFSDQKRALLSRLLARRACAAVLGLRSFDSLDIGRTKGKKPFLRAPRPPADRPDLANFNFNVSHEGDWVVLASEPLCVCGVDVAAPYHGRPGAANMDFWRDFQEQLTSEEWAMVRRAAEEEALGHWSASEPPVSPPGYTAFQRFWSAKEAFVKARGDGLGFDLQRASFRFEAVVDGFSTCCSSASLVLSPSSQSLQSLLGQAPRGGESCSSLLSLDSRCGESAPPMAPVTRTDGCLAYVFVDGFPASDWRFFQHLLGDDHYVTVARGPTDDVQDKNGEFLRTLGRPTPQFTAAGWRDELEQDSPAFDLIPVGALVPEDAINAFVRAGGSAWPQVSK